MNELLIFTDLNGQTLYLPARSLSHWAFSPDGSLRLWAVGGADPIHPACAATVVTQLQRVGLLPELGAASLAPGRLLPEGGYARHPPSVEPLASPPEPEAAPPATPRNRRKA